MLRAYRVEITQETDKLDGKNPSQTITITEEPGKTIEQQAEEWAAEAWPGKEVFVAITGEFDEKGVLKDGKPIVSEPEIKVSSPLQSVKAQLNKARENVKILERQLKEMTANCRHQFRYPEKVGDSTWERVCTVCEYSEQTNKAIPKVVDYPLFD